MFISCIIIAFLSQLVECTANASFATSLLHLYLGARLPNHWLLHRFENRLCFTRSAAVWSVLGHAIGLGDRHAENILLDVTNGECVHVDFDCLFDKGLTLQRPEVCPFRLTPNMVDAMGITGYEGVFRSVCEVTLRVLRQEREMLVSVLQAFVERASIM